MKNVSAAVLVFVVSTYSLGARMLSGQIFDSSGEVVSYANIAIFNDSTFVSAVTADSCGVFSMKISDLLSPRVRVSMIGYETVDTLLSPQTDRIDISMSNSSVTLNEIEVRHTPPTVTMKGDVLVTNVLGTALQHAGSARDVLRHVPLISLGSNDGIEVFGRGTPAVYINGRKVSDLRELNQLRSENIKSVDVITNPGVGYSAEILSVIRIRTIKQRGEGFSSSVGLSETYNNRFTNAGDLNLRYRKNSLELFSEGSYSVGKHAYATGNDQWSAERLGGLLRQDAISDRIADMVWGAMKVGLSYDITPEHSVGAFYNYSYWRKYESLDNIQDVSVDGSLKDCWLMSGVDTTLLAPTHNVNFYYNGQLSDIQIDFNADYYKLDNVHNFSFDERNSAGVNNDIFINNSGDSRMLAEKLVLAYRRRAVSLEVGEEFTHSHLTSSSQNTGVPFGGSATKVSERNFAPFADLFYSWRNFRTGIGVRYEYTVNNFEIEGVGSRNRELVYSRFYQSASISWSGNDASVSLSFTNKSIRPTYSQLSDILQYSTRSKYWRGNPELDSERYYNCQLSVAWKYFFGMLMYTHTRDAIFQTYEPFEDDPEVSLITYRNVPTLNTLNSTIGFRHKVGFWSPTLTMSIAKQWHHLSTVDGRKDLSTPVVRIRYDNTFNLPENWTAMLSFDFTSGGDVHNQSNRSRHSLDASVAKTFFGGDLTVRADATDLLNRSYLRYSIYNEIGHITCLDTWPSRSIKLAVRYSFNTASSRYKGRGAGASERSRM